MNTNLRAPIAVYVSTSKTSGYVVVRLVPYTPRTEPATTTGG